MTYAFAIGGAIVLALTLTPVLAGKFVPAQTEEKEPIVMRALHRLYSPLFALALRAPAPDARHRAASRSSWASFSFRFLGGEFMPHLEEGNFWIRATLPMSISLEQSAKYVGQIRVDPARLPAGARRRCDEAHRKHPEVLTVVSQLGRPDDGTDVAGFQNIELFAPLAPFDEWPRGVTKDKLTDELSKELARAFPGVVFNFSQMISDNVEEAVSGVKGENSVKVFGNDLELNEKNAQAIVDVMSTCPGSRTWACSARWGSRASSSRPTASRARATA